MSNTSSPASAPSPALAVATATLFPWSRLPGPTVVDVGPSSGSMFELPGPKTRPVRPHLELAAGPTGLAARVVQGDGKVAALALRDGEVIPLAAAPLAVAARSDGLWAMYRDSLIAHDRKGAVLHKVALSAVGLVAGAGDAAWVMSNEQAWHVDAGGAIHGPYAWRDPLTAFVTGGKLCARDRHDDHTLACLAGDGTASTLRLAVALAPLEQPIALDGDRLATLQGVTLRLRRGSELTGAWTFQVAGLDAAGAGFALTADDTKLALWRAAPAGGAPTSRGLAAPGSGSLGAAGVAGEDVTLYGQGWSTHYHGPTAAPSAQIDEAAYRATVFPAVWELAALHAIALRSDGTIVVAASGATGAALVELKPAA